MAPCRTDARTPGVVPGLSHMDVLLHTNNARWKHQEAQDVKEGQVGGVDCSCLSLLNVLRLVSWYGALYLSLVHRGVRRGDALTFGILAVLRAQHLCMPTPNVFRCKCDCSTGSEATNG